MHNVERRHRRAFGQFFTPPSICAIACAAAFGRDAKRVIDPTCGTGEMLVAAASRAKHLGLQALEVTGIEVDPDLTVRVAEGVTNSVIRDDLFAVLAQFNGLREMNHRFDAVVGNPPYVRFESLGSLYRGTNPQLLNLMATRFPGRADGELAALGIKTLLLMSCIPAELGLERRLDAARVALATGGHLESLTEHERLWAEAVADYPIRADLSIPVWLAAWRLVRPGGRIAFVTTDSWESRAYGRSLRRFIGAALQPVLILRQRGSWFRDAQVRASLVVFEARTHDPGESFLTVEAPQDANLAEARTLSRLMRSHRFGAPQDALESAAPELLKFLASRDHIPGWRLQRSTAAGTLHRVRVQASTHTPSPFLPEDLRRIVPHHFVERLAPLQDDDVTVQQGLRTGCNPFFYTTSIFESEDTVTVRTDVEVGGDAIAIDRRYLMPVLRYQREIQGFATSSGALTSRAIVIRGGLTARDHKRARELYPDEWLREWADTAGLHALAGDLDAHVERSATRALLRGGRERRIPQLSAVQPNERWPAIDVDGVPSPPRGWYSLAIAPRHVPDILVARVVDRQPRFVLNDAGVLVDANFSSLIIVGRLPKEYYLAVLNSSWVRTWAEFACTPMGGGALKVEAEQLVHLPFPRHEGATVEMLSRLGSELTLTGRASETWLQTVDGLVLGRGGRLEELRREGGAMAMRRSSGRRQLVATSS